MFFFVQLLMFVALLSISIFAVGSMPRPYWNALQNTKATGQLQVVAL